jgi:hypothetical protein
VALLGAAHETARKFRERFGVVVSGRQFRRIGAG